MPVTTLKVAKRLDTPVTMAALLDAYNCESALRMVVPPALLDGGAITRTEMAAILNDWAAALTAPKLILFTNPVTPTPGTILGDLTQPTASWYTSPVLVLGAAFANADGTLEIDGVSHQFNYSGADPACTIYGWGITDTV